MKKISLALLILSSLNVFAQTVSKEDVAKEVWLLNEKIQLIQGENIRLKSELATMHSNVSITMARVESLQKQIKANSSALSQTSQELGNKIQETGKSSDEKISAVDKSLSKTSLYGIIGVLLAIIGSGIIYVLLIKRQKSDKSDLIDQLNKTKSSIEESLIHEFGKQTELLDTQLLQLGKQKNNNFVTQNSEPDHSLALKVASEINLIERNVRLMDPKTKGIKQLMASVGKLKDNLAANGYEIPELLGKQYHQGMNVIVTSSIPDENLEKGSEKVTKVIIPQVNYNDKMIQTAQVEVSVG
jgi:hypothetical protein